MREKLFWLYVEHVLHEHKTTTKYFDNDDVQFCSDVISEMTHFWKNLTHTIHNKQSLKCIVCGRIFIKVMGGSIWAIQNDPFFASSIMEHTVATRPLQVRRLTAIFSLFLLIKSLGYFQYT